MMERLDHYAITSTYTGANSQFRSRLTAAGLFAIAAVAIVACSPTEELDNDAYNRTVRLWNRESGAEVSQLPKHPAQVWAVSYASDSGAIATG